jgi:hypothetical protein
MANSGPTWNAKVPRKLAEKVVGELAADEEVLWVGRPGRTMPYSSLRWSRMLVFIALGLVCGVFALATDGTARIVCAIVATVAWLLVLGGFALPYLWKLGVVQENFAYLVTNRRVLICFHRPTTGTVELHSYTSADLDAMACVERDDGSGDIRFDGGTDQRAALDEGLFEIDRVREVERLIRDTLSAK